MHITRVTAKNFKTLSDFELSLTSGYCALSGQNNCGKTSVLKIIEHFLNAPDEYDPILARSTTIQYSRDKTQWDGTTDDIDIGVEMEVYDDIDSEIHGFIAQFSKEKNPPAKTILSIKTVVNIEGQQINSCYVNGLPQDDRSTTEIIKEGSQFKEPNYS